MVEGVLKRHRIRRLTAENVIAVLRRPGLTVAPGTVEAASAHIRLVRERINVINAQLKECDKRLDALCLRLFPPKTAKNRGRRSANTVT